MVRHFVLVSWPGPNATEGTGAQLLHSRYIPGEAMTLFPGDGNRKQLENQARAEGRLPPGQSLTLQ